MAAFSLVACVAFAGRSSDTQVARADGSTNVRSLAAKASRGEPVSARTAAAATVARVCSAGRVEGLVRRFLKAFNRGQLTTLDRLFDREPGFEWYSTSAPGERLSAAAYRRSTLIGYFRLRHALDERLRLRSFRFNGNSSDYGNFEYALTRTASDLEPTAYSGKGAAHCRATADTIFVWSMGPE